MHSHLRKNIIAIGNFPIYNKDGMYDLNGPDYIINLSVKKDFNVGVLKFINQKDPKFFNVNLNNFCPELNLDMSSIVQIKTLLIDDFNMDSDKYIQVFNTQTHASGKSKGAFFNISNNIVKIILDNKEQPVFNIKTSLQIKTFVNLLDIMLKILLVDNIELDKEQMQLNPIKKLDNEAPDPIESGYLHTNVQAAPPASTKSVIPQAPKI